MATVPDDFPRFIVPGWEAEMESLRQLFWQHYAVAGPQIPVWDEWLPNATLWPAQGEGAAIDDMRRRWAQALAHRVMNDDGYIHTQQHDGPAHAEGWPFPMWMQAGGIGWHFRPIGVPGYEAPLVTPVGWKLHGGVGQAVDHRGWNVDITDRDATMQAPECAVEARNLPWLRLNWWAKDLESANCYIEWTTKDEPQFAAERRVYFRPPSATSYQDSRETRTMIPVYRHLGWKGTITGLRIGLGNAIPAHIVIKSFHTACDTRQNVNNLNFIRGCHDYFLWSRDVPFLRDQIGRVRLAMQFVEREFQTRERKCIYTTWPGHEGRSGVRLVNGQKAVLVGEGIGNNYWDLLPFGGQDALATVYYFDTLLDLAELEEIIAAHSTWDVPGKDARDANDLRRHAAEVKDHFCKQFWNEATGRFGTVDLNGKMYDYGFTFLNNEAIVLGIATPGKAQSIESWMNGTRTVAGDTSTGADIYHWRFGPRSTTRRNLDYYYWGWSNPESIPWGGQVQDGGAVLGWTYYDLMARLMTTGPDSAAARLRPIAQWFDEVQRDGGYRAFYSKDPARGTLQGGNVAGGLGLDKEFVESVLATQVMLYGFLGFRPTIDGFAVSPRLPKDWPELTITRIYVHNQVLAITATAKQELKISGIVAPAEELVIEVPKQCKLSLGEGVKARIERRAGGGL